LEEKAVIRCQCGKFQGLIKHIELGTRAICYCTDCQIYAHYLQAPDQILNRFGGTEVIAVRPKNIAIVHGSEYLSCLSLTQFGAFRFFADCCKTPICNMSRNSRTEHISVIHRCLNHRLVAKIFDDRALHVKRKSAHGSPPKNKPLYFIASSLYYVYSILLSRISRGYQFNPFINQENQKPIASRVILDAAELNRLKDIVV
jgi:Family of unknown function (DUF6151)